MPAEDIAAIQMAFVHLYASLTLLWLDSDTLNQQPISFGGPTVEVNAST